MKCVEKRQIIIKDDTKVASRINKCKSDNDGYMNNRRVELRELLRKTDDKTFSFKGLNVRKSCRSWSTANHLNYSL